MRSRVLLITAFVLASMVPARGAEADVAAPPPPVSGGSNYDFYYLDSCYREPYQVVNSFNKAPDIIRFQLAGMRKAGQNRLSIGIFHHHGPDTGTVMNSTGGTLSSQDLRNLTALLAAIEQAGYAELTVVMNPLDANDPSGWPSWQQAMYDENWKLIQTLHPIIAAAGVPYRIDLGNELTESTGQTGVLAYDQRLWQDYTARFGLTNTVGFSVNSNDPGQILNVGKMYGSTPPPMFDLHVYGSEYDQFVYDDTELRQQGFSTQPVIIGESYYNDKDAATAFSSASRKTGRQIYYLTQWPRTRANNTQCDQVDVAPPTDYAMYAAAGF